jgi:uncharacterized protein (DUF924 family)
MRDLQQEILKFWFEETKPVQWFQKNDDFDELIKSQFDTAYTLARQGILEGWKETPLGCLAYILLLDQFPRNMFRGTAQAFETDAHALEIAKHAIEKHFDQALLPIQKRFIYLPFEHSEAIEDQEESVSLFEKTKKDDPLGYDYAVRHLKVIERFGRFPHRNALLGRKNTTDETEFLKKPENSF